MLRTATIIGLSALLSHSVWAEPYRISVEHPTDYEQVKDVLEEIEEDLEKATFGGWDFEDTVFNKVARVNGAPGREGLALGNIKSGLAWRDEVGGALKNGFVFPRKAEVEGWSSACRPGNGEAGQNTPPYYNDFPCTDEGDCLNMCVRINKWQGFYVECLGTEIYRTDECRENPLLEPPRGKVGLAGFGTIGGIPSTGGSSGLTGQLIDPEEEECPEDTLCLDAGDRIAPGMDALLKTYTGAHVFIASGSRIVTDTGDIIEIGEVAAFADLELGTGAKISFGSGVKLVGSELIGLEKKEDVIVHFGSGGKLTYTPFPEETTSQANALLAQVTEPPPPEPVEINLGSLASVNLGDTSVITTLNQSDLITGIGNAIDYFGGGYGFPDPQQLILMPQATTIEIGFDLLFGVPGCEKQWFYCCTNDDVTKYEYETLKDISHPDAFRNCIQCQGDGSPVVIVDEDDNAIIDDTLDHWGEEIPAVRSEQRNETGCRAGRYATVLETTCQERCQQRDACNDTPDEPPGCYECCANGGGDECFDGASVSKWKVTEGMYLSFYRKYRARYSRGSISKVPTDVSSADNIPMACYGLYREYDPRTQQVQNRQKFCSIGGDHFRQLRTSGSQEGIGEYGQNLDLDDPAVEDPVRNPSFDEEKDLWFPNLGGAFSLLNPQSFEERANENMSMTLMNTDGGVQRATVQLKADPKRLHVSDGALLRATDHTVCNQRGPRRTITEWWQELQTSMNILFSPHGLILVLPAPETVDLDLSDPFFTGEENEAPEIETIRDPQTESVAVRVHAGENTLSRALQYVQRTLTYRLQEKEIPVVVPVGSPAHFRTLAHQWQAWLDTYTTNEDGTPNGTTAPPEALEIIERLEEYAVRIEKVRALRGELAQYSGKLMENQKKTLELFEQALSGALGAYDTYRADREALNGLRNTWEETQEQMHKFHQQYNLFYPRNDRFTNPIYSMLDEWLPGREQNGLLTAFIDKGPDESLLPKVVVQQGNDVVFDLTLLRTELEPIDFPVLKPLQLRIDNVYLEAPDVNAGPPSKWPELEEDLPDIPSIFEDIDVLSIDGEAPTVSIPAPVTDEVEEVLNRAKEIIEDMSDEYSLFWRSITSGGSSTSSAPCPGPHTAPCVMSEMELKELIRWAGARPAIILPEDLQSAGEFRKEPDGPSRCVKSDWSCRFLNPRNNKPLQGFRLLQQESNDDKVEELRRRMIDETVPARMEEGAPKFRYKKRKVQLWNSMFQPEPTNIDPSGFDLIPPASE